MVGYMGLGAVIIENQPVYEPGFNGLSLIYYYNMMKSDIKTRQQ